MRSRPPVRSGAGGGCAQLLKRNDDAMSAFCNKVSLVALQDAAKKEKPAEKYKKTGQEWCVATTFHTACFELA